MKKYVEHTTVRKNIFVTTLAKIKISFIYISSKDNN